MKVDICNTSTEELCEVAVSLFTYILVWTTFQTYEKETH